MNKTVFLIVLSVIALFSGLYFYMYGDKQEKRVLSVLAWQGSFSREVVDLFEKKTGIIVHLNYYATNEELLAKLHLTNGVGIDIIVPSDYIVERIKNEGFIQPLDSKKIESINDLYKKLLDPVKEADFLWAVPLEWGMYGIGVHPDWYKNNKDIPDLFNTFFFPESAEKKPRICMTNDSPAACMAAYLHSGNDELNYSEILKFLNNQRPYVVAYSDGKIGNMLLAGEIDMAYMQSDEFLRTSSQMPELCFFLHPNGALKTVEYAALSSQSNRSDAAYEFLNFMLSKEIMEMNMSSLCYLPTRMDLMKSDLLLPAAHDILNFTKDDNYRLIGAFDVLPEEKRLKLWVELKS